MVTTRLASALGELEPLAELLKLLSDGTRLRILTMLAKGERNVTSLCEELGLPQPTVSHHLGLLRTRNIIANRRDGKQVFYGLGEPVQAGLDNSMEVRAEGFTIRLAGSGISAGAGSFSAR